jgi:hypothetical protein
MKVSRRPLYLLEGANALSGLSNAIAIITVPWLIFERTGSATQAGIVVAGDINKIISSWTQIDGITIRWCTQTIDFFFEPDDLFARFPKRGGEFGV